MKRILSVTVLGLSIIAISPVFAADGYVTGDVNLRAGPDTSYPRVAMLRAGEPVAIEGCVDGWSWCDVATVEDRGWVAGNFLQEEYQGQRVLIPDYGLQIGIPVVSFAFGSYWDQNYRGRSWYGNREQWSRVQPKFQRTTVAPASRTPDESRRSGVAATSAAHQAVPAHKSAPQHPMATDFRSQEKISGHERPIQHNAAESRATIQPNAVATQKAAEPSPQHREVPVKSTPAREGGKDKDQQH
jgi:uncharacterized protein YraI